MLAHKVLKLRQLTITAGVAAALLVVFTSAFQFTIGTSGLCATGKSASQLPAAGTAGQDEDESPSDAPSVCTLQAVSHSAPIHLPFVPIVWEAAKVDVSHCTRSAFCQVFMAGRQFFKVLFQDIISPNAP